MAIELHRLMEQVSQMDITLVAGKDGLHNLVSWVHMVETIEASDFLEGGEIAFTTGLGIHQHVSLLTLVTTICEKKAAGIIINIGPFLETVTDDVIAFGDEHAFPIFVVPWKTHLAEIMRIFCFSITKDDQRMLETAAAFKNAIFFPKQEELYVVPLSQRGFRISWNYAVCVIKIANISSDLPSRLESLAMTLNNHMQHDFKNIALFSHDAELLMVSANYSDTSLRPVIAELSSYLAMLLQKKECITLGIGKITKSVRCLYKSYHQAKSIQKLQENNKIDPSLIFYSDMGIYKLLMEIEDKEILREYYEATIRPLIEYDQKNNSDLTEILRCYLKNNGSVKETADLLFVHRNTINYKLTKIEELLHTDLSSLDTRLQMSIGYMLQDIL